jgi:hypothetical protein
MIKNRENEYQNARNATIKNMQNTIMAQGVINDLIDTVVNQSNKNKAATKIQNVFKNKKDLKKELEFDKFLRSSAIKLLNDRLSLELKSLQKYADSPKKIDKINLKIKKTINEIQKETKQFDFLTEKINKL